MPTHALRPSAAVCPAGAGGLDDVMEAMSAQVMSDWHTFGPIRAHIMEQAGRAFPALATGKPGIDRIHWPNLLDHARELEDRNLSGRT